MTVATPEHLHRGLAVDHRGDDLTGMSFVLAAHHDDVTVTDRCVDHRLTTHPKSEHRAGADELARKRKHLVGVLLREDRRAGRDVTDDRNRHRIRRRLFLRAYEERPHVQLPSHGRSPTEEALLFETLEVLGHRRRRAQTNRVSDLPCARRAPVGSHEIPDGHQNLLLAERQGGGVEATEHVEIVVIGHDENRSEGSRHPGQAVGVRQKRHRQFVSRAAHGTLS